MPEPMALAVGDVVQMRKKHPCGGDTWCIVRVGADIGIRCLTCERKVLLPRAECERRIKRIVSHSASSAASTTTASAGSRTHESNDRTSSS